MKTLLIIALMLSACLFGDEPILKIDNTEYWLSFNAAPINYNRCEVCGRDVPSWLGVKFYVTPFAPITSTMAVAARKAMFPYDMRPRFVCMRCVFERLGIKPDWQMPEPGEQ
jgi:hypothetical protein